VDEYSKRNQSDVTKLEEDISQGKIAEILVFKLLRKMGKNPHGLDFLIYNKQDKTFGADIIVDAGSIHVKSCNGESSLPNSWVFQPKDPLTISPSSTDYLALVVIGQRNYCYLIKALEVVYKPPIKKSLRKKVVYENDINPIL
jgi:hypothetical protein